MMVTGGSHTGNAQQGAIHITHVCFLRMLPIPSLLTCQHQFWWHSMPELWLLALVHRHAVRHWQVTCVNCTTAVGLAGSMHRLQTRMHTALCHIWQANKQVLRFPAACCTLMQLAPVQYRSYNLQQLLARLTSMFSLMLFLRLMALAGTAGPTASFSIYMHGPGSNKAPRSARAITLTAPFRPCQQADSTICTNAYPLK